MKTFGPNKYGIPGVQRKFQNEELHNLYSSPNFITAIKSRKVRLVHVARMDEMRNTQSGTETLEEEATWVV
jgi:hypothetical protein